MSGRVTRAVNYLETQLADVVNLPVDEPARIARIGRRHLKLSAAVIVCRHR